MREYADIVFRRTKIHPPAGGTRWRHGVVQEPCRLPAKRTPHIVGTNVAVGTHSQEKHKEKYT